MSYLNKASRLTLGAFIIFRLLFILVNLKRIPQCTWCILGVQYVITLYIILVRGVLWKSSQKIL